MIRLQISVAILFIMLASLGCQSPSPVKLSFPDDYRIPTTTTFTSSVERDRYLLGHRQGWRWFADQHELRVMTSRASASGPFARGNMRLLPDTRSFSTLQAGWSDGEALARSLFDARARRIRNRYWKVDAVSRHGNESRQESILRFSSAPVSMVLDEYATLAEKELLIERSLFFSIQSKQISLRTDSPLPVDECMALIEREIDKLNMAIIPARVCKLQLVVKDKKQGL